MYNNVLQAIDNIVIWPVVSFVIFFIFFIVLVWWAFTADRDFINRMKSLPMDNESTVNNNDHATH